MTRNSVTGRFRDIEILFSIDGDATIMSVRNLVNNERQVRIMYQKLLMSGLANWAQFQLTDAPVSRRLPTEILEAYRLTFFVDDADPVSARIEKILTELEALKPEQSVADTSETLAELDPLKSESLTEVQDKVQEPLLGSPRDLGAVAPTPPLETQSNGGEPSVPEVEATQQIEAAKEAPMAEASEPIGTGIDADEYSLPDVETTQQVKEKVAVPHPSGERPLESMLPEREQVPERKPVPGPMALRLPVTQDAVPVSSIVDSNLEFKIAVPSLPLSARAVQRKAEATAQLGTTALKRREKGVFGHLVQALGLAAGGRRGKAYYQQKGEAVQNAFQDELAKLERDYNEGYGLNLLNWDMDTLSESEIAILLLNLMVSEVIAWRKETGRATPETEQLVQVLDEVNTRLRRTLKQTRGVSTPAPTLFPDLLAESERDLEKIQDECDAYLQRFTSKLIEQEKNHAEKIEVLIFKKFLIEFIRDFLFVEVVESTQGNALPKRLNWFLDLVDSEVIPIEVGETKVSPKYHKVKGARSCEFETGTIVEVVKAGLQSKDGKRVNQTAVVIEAE
ncbi:hypothetical protein F4141_04735 [Candidatus Poribacteria bacterium]|nr:hypothetical protein [Candidatus Poribacteria bacterium]MYH79994.1 hypothetical protein [Candidatus Poribacteria bacterium]